MSSRKRRRSGTSSRWLFALLGLGLVFVILILLAPMLVMSWVRGYLQQDGYTDTYQELLDSTDWSKYGYESGNAKCENCMLHSGYEATAVHYTFTIPGIIAISDEICDIRKPPIGRH